MKKYSIDSIDLLPSAAKQLLEQFPSSRIFAFHGNLGAGKTTFIKALCKQLGVKDAMSSPSFSIINEYETGTGDLVYHFDLYRLKSAEEAFDTGMEDYLYCDNYCFIEWPERAEEILPPETVHVFLEEIPEGRRIRY
jgi:tRNA threonylcarbamoyladenosine biosynthesis protein TsaE